LDGGLPRGSGAELDKLFIALSFWDGWIDARNHEWQYYPGIEESDWPKLAKEIVKALAKDQEITQPTVLAHFDLRDQGKGDRSKMISDGAITLCCVLFLIVSFGLWMVVDSSFEKTLYYVFFIIPNYVCAEWLAGKLFSKRSGLSVSQSGFSIMRIVVGVIFVIVVFGVAYGITALLKH
jgi:hypothetical protein